MQKTRKSIAKKFKITSSGKVMRRKPGFRHCLKSKSVSQGRRARQDHVLDSKGLSKQVKIALPHI